MSLSLCFCERLKHFSLCILKIRTQTLISVCDAVYLETGPVEVSVD